MSESVQPAHGMKRPTANWWIAGGLMVVALAAHRLMDITTSATLQASSVSAPCGNEIDPSAARKVVFICPKICPKSFTFGQILSSVFTFLPFVELSSKT